MTHLKQAVDDLALFSGTPAFEQPLHVGRPNIAEKASIMQHIEGVLDRRWLTNDGPCVRELEQRIAKLAGVKHCVAICNGTVALEIAIRALGLRDEVIVPSFTFVATAHALAWQGMTPVFADVDPNTHTLDPKDVESKISSVTTGIIGVHLWGRSCNVEALAELARSRGLKLIFDAAHAFGCTHKGRSIGGFGDAEIYSFHATKFFNTFEGGAIATNDDEIAKRARLIRNFGFEGYDNVVEIGTNGKMAEVCAAMGLASLEVLPQIIETNRSNHDRYRTSIEAIPGLSLVQYSPAEKANYQYVVALVEAQEAGLTRDELVAVLHAEGALARRYFAPGAHGMPAYRRRYPAVNLPHTDWLCERVLCLPTGTAITAAEINGICRILQLAVANASKVRERLRASR